jgi:hypothetical protein
MKKIVILLTVLLLSISFSLSFPAVDPTPVFFSIEAPEIVNVEDEFEIDVYVRDNPNSIIAPPRQILAPSIFIDHADIDVVDYFLNEPTISNKIIVGDSPYDSNTGIKSGKSFNYVGKSTFLTVQEAQPGEEAVKTKVFTLRVQPHDVGTVVFTLKARYRYELRPGDQFRVKNTVAPPIEVEVVRIDCANDECDPGEDIDSCADDGGVNDCDPDGDGVDDRIDNCPFVDNPGQEDDDNDGSHDICNFDVDPHVLIANPPLIHCGGNVCDLDDDNDGVLDCGLDGECGNGDDDACPDTRIGDDVDVNGCSEDQLQEGDDDQDGILNDVDQCLLTPPGKNVYSIDYIDHAGCQLGDANHNGCIDLPDWGMFADHVSRFFEDGNYATYADLSGVNGLDLADLSIFATVVSNDFSDCLDDDNDGVMNEYDDCAGTVPGALVNNRGCVI